MCDVHLQGPTCNPAKLRRKHKIEAGTKVKVFEDQFGRIVLQPITDEYIDRVRGMLADGPDLLGIWEKEHREEGKHEK